MKIFFALFLYTAVMSDVRAQACRTADPKKVVLMVSFHDGAEEERHARQAACARGETLVVVPRASAELTRLRAQMQPLSRRIEALYTQQESCRDDACLARIEQQMAPINQQYGALQERAEEMAPDYQGQLSAFLASARSNNAKVSSLIISGHDGGGEFYGDYGRTDIASISQMVNENREAFNDVSSLLLMGCWTGTPDQVEQWRTVFPNMRVLGGFVGSAPSSTRLAAGTFVSGILRGERNLRREANRSEVQAMINQVQHMNMVTAGVYINPSCDEEGRSPAYYYISPANEADEIPAEMRPGLNILPTADARTLACRRAFGAGEDGARGSFDWNAVMQYFQGEREPENNPELRGLYSFLRNNQHCFTDDLIEAAFEPDQVLMLRFYQDAKKNFGKFFKKDLEDMYKALDALVEASTDPQVKSMYQDHKKLMGDSLNGMTRRETLLQISKLTGTFDRIMRVRETPEQQEQDRPIREMMRKIDTHLYRLKCLPPEWHDHSDSEVLAAPTC